MSTVIPAQAEKCKGAMVATAIGDALGWPNELRSSNKSKNSKINDFFVEWTRRSKKPCYHDERILPGEYSDDTQMTLSVARSIIVGNWEKFLIEKELPFWLGYERGGGGALLKAAESCKKGVLLWKSNYTRDYFNAGGNGAVMRILPHVIAATHNPSIADLMINVIKDTIITHGHPRAILGATCYAYALNYLLKKETILEYGELVAAVIDGQKYWGEFPNLEIFKEWLDVASHHSDLEYANLWEITRASMTKQLEFIKASLKKGLMLDDTSVLTQLECFSKANGAGDVAALAAIYLASRYANNPALGIKVPAFSFGADTDTIASITGGLLGMLCGTNWIPSEWKVVQDYDCLIQITELLLLCNDNEAVKADVAESKAQDHNWRSTPIGHMRAIGKVNVQNGNYAIVTITKWQSALGQTLYTKDMQRLGNASYQPEAQMQLQMQLTANEVRTQVPVQIPVAPQERPRQFALDSAAINALRDNPQLNKKITLGKVLQIINALLHGDESTSAITKRLGVGETTVEIIKTYING